MNIPNKTKRMKNGKIFLSEAVCMSLKDFAENVVKTKGGDFDIIYQELRRLYRAGQIAFKEDIVTFGLN